MVFHLEIGAVTVHSGLCLFNVPPSVHLCRWSTLRCHSWTWAFQCSIGSRSNSRPIYSPSCRRSPWTFGFIWRRPIWAFRCCSSFWPGTYVREVEEEDVTLRIRVFDFVESFAVMMFVDDEAWKIAFQRMNRNEMTCRFTPYEWPTPSPCDPHPGKMETQFTLMNCMWFAIGSLMQQGCDFLPK